MPVTASLSTANQRLCNTAFAKTFFPRVMRSVWPRLCGTTKSSSIFEVFAFLGAAPMLKYFQGTIASQPIGSFSMKVPNPAWKSYEVIKRNMFEFDQTLTLPARVGQHGVRVAQLTDYLLANVLINGKTSGSQNFTNFDDGVTYTMTFDGNPLFGSHTLGGTTFNNILTGNLPISTASIISQDITVSANQMQRDVVNINQFIASLVDDKGVLLYPDFDMARQLILMVPPILEPVAELAFRTQGTLGGSNGSSSGSTTNIGYKIVKDVIPWNLLQGCPNMLSNLPTATLAPTWPTTYYWAIDSDYVKPFYFQRFMPLKRGESIPLGEDAGAQAEKLLSLAGNDGIKIRPEDAEVYAATEIDTNLGALGANAQESVATREEFFISARSRQMVYPGPWMNCGCVDPTGETT